MCLFGAVLFPEYNNATACANAVLDLNLDLVVITFQYGNPDWTHYDEFCQAIPQGQILALIQITAGGAGNNPCVPTAESISPSAFAAFAVQVKNRYPGIGYFEIINEPDWNSGTLVPCPIPPTPAPSIGPYDYFDFYIAAKNALTTAGGPPVIVHGPNTRQFAPAYNPSDGKQYFHGYGNVPASAKRYYWMTECAKAPNNVPEPICVWQQFMNYGAAIYLPLQNALAGTKGIQVGGLLDSSGIPIQPYYDQAKNWLMNPTPTTACPTPQP